MVAVRQAGFYCYSVKLDAPSRYGLLVWLHLVFGSWFDLMAFVLEILCFLLQNKLFIPSNLY